MLDYDIVVSNRLRAGRPAGALERGRQDEAFFISAFCRLWGQDHSSAGKKAHPGHSDRHRRCNLKCRHCSVHDLTSVDHPYEQIRREMELLYHMGVRILFFCGGETFLWHDGARTVRDLVVEAKKMGFLLVNVVTNGTFPIDLPEADLILLSLDGDRARHNAIRGDTYDTIMEHVEHATSDNICFYMAINQINKGAVRDVCLAAQETKNVRAVSFNFHTPYPDTRELALTGKKRRSAAALSGR